MSEGLGRAAILELFEELSSRLAAKGARADLFLVGGGAMAVAYDSRRATRDLDAVFAPNDVVRTAVAEIATDRGLDEDWLNDAVKASCRVRIPIRRCSSSRNHYESTSPRRRTSSR